MPLCWWLSANHGLMKESLLLLLLGSPVLIKRETIFELSQRRLCEGRTLQLEVLFGAFWAFREKVNTGMSVQTMSCPAIAQFSLSRWLKTVFMKTAVSSVVISFFSLAFFSV